MKKNMLAEGLMLISGSVLLRNVNDLDQLCAEKQNRHFVWAN